MSDDKDIPELIDIPIPPRSVNMSPMSVHSISTHTFAPDDLAAPIYDFENELEEPWDAYCPTPSQRADQNAPVRLTFTRHWLLEETTECSTIGSPPQWLGMEIRADGFSHSINLPKSFKEARSTPPVAYREYWPSLKGSPAFSLLTSSQKDVIRGILATMRFFCDNSYETRRQWPHF